MGNDKVWGNESSSGDAPIDTPGIVSVRSVPITRVSESYAFDMSVHDMAQVATWLSGLGIPETM